MSPAPLPLKGNLSCFIKKGVVTLAQEFHTLMAMIAFARILLRILWMMAFR